MLNLFQHPTDRSASSSSPTCMWSRHKFGRPVVQFKESKYYPLNSTDASCNLLKDSRRRRGLDEAIMR
jgi:hypothetical protein